MMENYLYIMYNQINKAMQKIMRSLFIATLLLVSMGMGAYAQETKKTFTPEQQEIIDLSNAKWKWMSEKDVDKLFDDYVLQGGLYIWVVRGVSSRSLM